LDDCCRYSQAIMSRIKKESRVDEFARPQAVFLVRKVRLELDRAGRLQNLVVDETELSLAELDRVVLVVGTDRERGLGLWLLLLDLRQDGLGKGKNQRDRIELRDDAKAVGRRRADDVADIDLANADHTIDRRGQSCEAKLHFCSVDQSLVSLDRGLQLSHLSV